MENNSTPQSRVQDRKPKAFSFQWTGYWRIYANGLTDREVIGGPCEHEWQAWEQADKKLEAAK